jgi:sporulation protein YlmC with PRC-barrel domain
MLAKHIAAGLVGSALLATVAFAQQSPTATSDKANMAPAPAAASESSFQGNWRASKLVGVSVYNDNNESLGSINDLLMDKDGNIKGVVLGVGGFLGVGEHLVAVPFDKIKFVNEPVAYTGVAGGPNANAPGTRPAPSTTTGAATTNTAPATAPAAAATTKSNPWYPDHAVFSATKDQLKAMPEFKYAT